MFPYGSLGASALPRYEAEPPAPAVFDTTGYPMGLSATSFMRAYVHIINQRILLFNGNSAVYDGRLIPYSA